MQQPLFVDEDSRSRHSSRQVSDGRRRSGARDAVSRYSKLSKALDQDVNNGHWFEVDTSVIGTSAGANFVDLFAGAGGISVGARAAGFTKLLSIEIDSDASSTLRRNFPESVHIEAAIEDVTTEEIVEAVGSRRVHVVFGGPPCQGFSVAGLRNPRDPRNRLFTEFVRVVGVLKPDFVVLENVPGILTMEQGRVRKEICAQFAEAGYPGMSVRILEAAQFGVPQLRTRAIFVANRHGLPNPYPARLLSKHEYVAIEEAIGDLAAVPRSGVPNHEWTRHSKAFEARIAKVSAGESLYDTFRDAFKRQYRGVPSMTVKENHGGCHIHHELDRVLSAREMARLQTFPDDYVFEGRFKRVYWQVGNAVPCTLAEHLAKAIAHAVADLDGEVTVE